MKTTALFLLTLTACSGWENQTYVPPPPPYVLNTANVNQDLPTYDSNITDSLPVQGVYQDAIGDCWFMATLASMALRDPKALEDRITFQDANDATVSFFDANSKVHEYNVAYAQIENTIDYGLGNKWSFYFEQGLIEFNNETHTINPNDGDLGITGNSAYTAWKVLEDQNDFIYFTNMTANDPNVWYILTGFDTPMVAETTNPNDAYIVPSHAYTVVGAGMYQGTQAVMLRNPWGINWPGGMGDTKLSNQGIVVLDLNAFIHDFDVIEFLGNN